MSANPFDQDVPMHDGNGADIDLSAFDDDFEAAEAPSFDEVPDGKYQSRVDRMMLVRSQNDDPMIKWEFVILSGAHESRHIFKNSVISRKALPYVKKDLATVGLELGKLSDLPGRLQEALDKTVELTVRTKGEFTNVYINKLIELPDGADSSGVPW